jgi:RNA polymerase sigma-70 factor (ECF subfamily)
VKDPDSPEQPPTQANFAACYAEHHRRIYHVCLRYGNGDHGFAEDITHDTFVRFLRCLPSLQDTDDVGAWLYRVATNLALSQLRRRRWWLAWLARNEEPARGSLDPGPESRAQEHEAAERALQTLAKLPPRERVMICMQLLDGKSQVEIADTLSLSEGYVSKLLARAWARIHAAGWEGEKP